jgi:hypothetical protein
MNRRGFLFAIAGAAVGGVIAASPSRAAQGRSAWDDLKDIDNAADVPAADATETQAYRRGRHRPRRRVVRRNYRRPRARYYFGPRQRRRYWGRRRVCRIVRNHYGYLVRRCWWIW